MTREPIIAALFAKLAAIPSLVTVGRVVKHLIDVPAEHQPALFLSPRNQSAIRRTGLPTKWVISVLVYIYTNRGGQNVIPDIQMNAILDAVETVLAPNGGVENQTLGGLCEYCRIEGVIETDEGALGDQSVAIVPIDILVTT